jgi:hypothetical protein
MKKLFCLLFLSGCFFGIYQRPQTIGEGNFDFSLYASFQITTNPYDRRDLKNSGYGLFSNLGFDFLYGITDLTDFGFHFSGAGLGPFLRFAVYDEKIRGIRNQFLIAPYILYEPIFSQSLGFRLDAIYSWRASKFFEPYIFYQMYYHPYFEEFFYNQVNLKPLGRVGSGFYHFVGFGSNFNIYLERSFKTPDIRFNFELGLMGAYLESQRRFIPVINMGLGFGGSGLFKCYRSKGKREFCPGDVFFNIIYLIFALLSQP